MRRLTNNLGMLLLGVYLIVIGLVPLTNLSLAGLGLLVHFLAIAAGVAILLGHMTRCGLSVLRFRQGQWRAIRVDIEPSRT